MNTKILWVLMVILTIALQLFGVIPTPAFLGALFFLIAFSVYKSVYSPKEGIAHIVALWGTKFWSTIKNSRKFKVVNWEVKEEKEDGGINIFFRFWPVFDVYQYILSYNKRISAGTERKEDKILYTIGKEIIVRRTSISNHLRFTDFYPIVTLNIRTKDGGVFNLLTTHLIRVKNTYLPLAETSNWLDFIQDKIDATILAIVAELTTLELISLKSDDATVNTFTAKMKLVNLGSATDTHDGIEEIVGMSVINSVLNGFEGADEATKDLLISLTAEKTAQNVGAATVATAKAEGQAILEKANRQAKANRALQNVDIAMARKRLLSLGLLVEKKEGKKVIGYEQVAEINSATWAEAFKETSIQFLGLDSNGLQGVMATILSAKGGTDGK